MATFALIHGGGSSAWDWHLVGPELEALGHTAVAMDLPTESPTATLDDYADAVVTAVGDHHDVIVVGHSLGGYTAPIAAERLAASGLVFLSAMIPQPGETFGDWWTNTGHDKEEVSEDPSVSFFNGVPDNLADEALLHERDQQGAWMNDGWPGQLPASMPTAAILCLDDQFFPAGFMRRQVRDRLGVEPIEIPGGHYAAISEPVAVARALDAVARSLA